MSNYNVYNQDGKGTIIKGWTKGVPVEDQAIQQAILCAQMPFIYKWLALMPDVHAGMGSTVGSVIPTVGAIMPSTVGVDLSCGMQALHIQGLTKLELAGREDYLLHCLGNSIPHGRTDNGGSNDTGRWQYTPEEVNEQWHEHLDTEYWTLVEKYPKLDRGNRVTFEHLGTLGTGNHFVEIAEDENGEVWILVHSGSRGIGARIGNDFMRLSKDMCTKWFIDLPHKDLAYFPQGTQEFDDYLEGLRLAQTFAKISRSIMVDNALKAIQWVLGEAFISNGFRFDCAHNYVATEHHFGKNVLVTRKGAVRAREGDWCIIPGSMGAKSYIAVGKGNKDSFMSCSHGAGRAMSRTAAKNKFSIDDHIKATEGVTCLKTESIIDETPGAYKDVQSVINAQSDLIDIKHVLKGFVCLKGA